MFWTILFTFLVTVALIVLLSWRIANSELARRAMRLDRIQDGAVRQALYEQQLLFAAQSRLHDQAGDARRAMLQMAYDAAEDERLEGLARSDD